MEGQLKKKRKTSGGQDEKKSALEGLVLGPIFADHGLDALPARSLLAMCSCCKALRGLLSKEAVWEGLAARGFQGMTLPALKPGIGWRQALPRLFIIAPDFDAVFSGSPSLFSGASFCIIEDFAIRDKIWGPELSEKCKRLILEDDLVEYYEEDERFEDILEDLSSIGDCASVVFRFGRHTYKVSLTLSGWYAELNGESAGHLDGHLSMPALRWSECKLLARHCISACSPDLALVMLSLLTFPSEDDKVDYIATLSPLWLATGLIRTSQLVELWASNVSCDPGQWVQDDETAIWTHTMGPRNPRCQDRARRISQAFQDLARLHGGKALRTA